MRRLLAVLFLSWGIGGDAASVGDDMETVRLNALRLFCWPAPDQLANVASSARSLALSLNASFYWSDINYDDPHDRADWRTITHLQRVQTIVEAYATPGSPAFEDPALAPFMHGALGVWLARHFVNDNVRSIAGQLGVVSVV